MLETSQSINPKNKKLALVFTAFIFLFVIATIFGLNFAEAQSVNSSPVTGWAWSSNIGWIKFDTGVSQPVIVNTSGNPNIGAFSGYAWSSNVGWISFNSADVANCPSISNPSLNGSIAPLDGCNPTIYLGPGNPKSGYVTGWARVLSMTASENGGGWLHLSGANHLTGTSGEGVKFNPATKDLTGYAYESTALGWIHFDALLGGTPSATCSINLAQINPDNTVSLAWSSSNNSNCTISGPGIPSGSTSGTFLNYTTTAIDPVNNNPAVYTLSCQPNAGYSAPTCNPNSTTVYPISVDDLNLYIGKSIDDINNKISNSQPTNSVKIKTGKQFALKWNNNLDPINYDCTAYTDTASLDPWTTNSGNSHGTKEYSNTNGLSLGSHNFWITCVDKDPALPVYSTKTSQVELKITDSSVEEF